MCVTLSRSVVKWDINVAVIHKIGYMKKKIVVTIESVIFHRILSIDLYQE